MIDQIEKTARLMEKLEAALPIPARAVPELIAMLRAEDPPVEVVPDCSVVSVTYGGDEGGIVCKLSFAPASDASVFASITHLRFTPRHPLAREIATYQKHRVKHLRRQR